MENKKENYYELYYQSIISKLVAELSELRIKNNKLMTQVSHSIAHVTAPSVKVASTNHIWELTETTAKDLTSGLTWNLKDEAGKYTYDEAVAKFGNKLPTIEEWDTAEKHSVREVLGLNDATYWSASVIATNRAGAWLFYGENGNVNYDYRNSNYSVRCIAR